MSTRRSLLHAAPSALAAAVLPRALQARAQPGRVALPQPASLQAALSGAVGAGKALVVMVSLDRCPYCALVRESYLAPLLAAGQPVVQVDMNRPDALADFHGARTTHGEVVRALGARVAPTVLFIGRGGREVAPRIAGVPLPDFYGAYLQERVDAGNRAVSA